MANILTTCAVDRVMANIITTCAVDHVVMSNILTTCVVDHMLGWTCHPTLACYPEYEPTSLCSHSLKLFA
jgi:hypothetical protein